MHSFLHSKLLYNLDHNIKVKVNNNLSVLLAISCGQDSLCLLKLFLDIQNIINIKLGIIHIDHQFRIDSNVNTQHMQNIIKLLNTPAYIYQLKPQIYSELEFRNMRYEIYIKTASIYSYNLIATAHTATDKLETSLNNMFKGGNLDSLHSLVWKRKIYKKLDIIRPLLNFTRGEISWLCRYYSLPIWVDYTNLYYINKRNRIRHELIPYLKQYYQHNLDKQMTIFLNKTYYDMEYLRQCTIKVYYYLRHPTYIAINYKLLLTQHLALQIRVLKLFFNYNLQTKLNDTLLKKILWNLENNTTTYIESYKLTLKIYKTWLYII
uniref:tRNA(Ile)-lysidine synthase, chloroplastic n=1 Tax=Trichogloeopsis pedicellata TaxID=1495610 RepID=A0A1G4P0C7_9FLOR|nr:tRNA Ile-lysidine synthetase [Trichogloeopsis pedicellata]SCW24354.1 tRNA Ile-lysidine synthetase [Trichogloeopsis pedicellata]